MTVRTDSRVKPQMSHGIFRVGQRILAVMPPDDLTDHRRDEREVVTVRAFAPGRDGFMRVKVADDDGVTTWIKLEMIVRHA